MTEIKTDVATLREEIVMMGLPADIRDMMLGLVDIIDGRGEIIKRLGILIEKKDEQIEKLVKLTESAIGVSQKANKRKWGFRWKS